MTHQSNDLVRDLDIAEYEMVSGGIEEITVTAQRLDSPSFVEFTDSSGGGNGSSGFGSGSGSSSGGSFSGRPSPDFVGPIRPPAPKPTFQAPDFTIKPPATEPKDPVQFSFDPNLSVVFHSSGVGLLR